MREVTGAIQEKTGGIRDNGGGGEDDEKSEKSEMGCIKSCRVKLR